MARSTDASIAFSVTDNLSESVVKMKNAITSTKQDAEQLQKTLDMLDDDDDVQNVYHNWDE